MPSRKTAPKRKRAAPAPSAPKKRQTVAAKQKHVRELAKTGRWAEIERFYGKKMVAKAKIYAEKHRVTKTPQEIARDILLKNGYTPVAPQPAAKTAPALKATRNTGPSSRGNTPVVDLTEQVTSINSPETLTKEQQELIERRRRDALERRKRAQRFVQPPVATQTNAVESARGCLQSSAARVPELQQRRCYPPPQVSRLGSNRPPYQPTNTTLRVVTPDNLPTTNPVSETEQARPEYLWDDLEAAAEIVQWENEHMAEVALENPRATGASQSLHGEFDISRGQQASRPTAASRVPSISQELAAAAEIIQWENEHELPSVIQRVDQCNDEKTHKRPLEATSPPALPGNNADSNKTTNCHGRDPVRPALSPPRNQHDPTAEFIEKHLLDGKLELPVLEFLDMMLA